MFKEFSVAEQQRLQEEYEEEVQSRYSKYEQFGIEGDRHALRKRVARAAVRKPATTRARHAPPPGGFHSSNT